MIPPEPRNPELFHIGENYYAAIQVDEQAKTFPLRLHAFKVRLSKLFYRARQTDKTENPPDSGQVEVLSARGRSIVPWGWCSRGWATGVLICAFLGAMPLLYSYRGQFGELLIQLGERLEVEPAKHAVFSSTPAPVPLADARPQLNAALPAHVPIPPSPPKNFSSPPLREAAEPQADLASPAPSVETSATSLMTPLPMSSMVPVSNLTPPKPVEPAQPEAANHDARETRNLVPSYANSSAGKYFDAGKFKDEFRAKHATDELEQLGFHAIIVHRRVLWMNSYRILVGPYSDQDEVEAARYAVASRGFNPRVLQSRSQHFSLPPMTLYGTDLTIRDCIITWELNSPEVTVEFMQGRKVVATSKGRWEKRDFAFKADAVVSLENGRGPETLLDIQRAGTDQELVLDGSALGFYMVRQ